jgi:hypothetical protein
MPSKSIGQNILARKMMSDYLGHPVPNGQDVHHIDGNIYNTIISNLTIMQHREHTLHHNLQRGGDIKQFQCDFCGKITWVGRFKFARRKNHFCSVACANRFRLIRPLKDELNASLISKENNMSAVGRYYGVSCSAVRNGLNIMVSSLNPFSAIPK